MNKFDWLSRLSRFQRPEHANSGWPPILALIYLGLLFMPLTWGEPSGAWLWATLFSLLVAVALFVYYLVRCARATVPLVLAFALLCYALEPFNPFSNTYLSYAAAFAPLDLPGLLRPVLLTAALLAGLTAEVLLLHQLLLIIGISVLVCTACCVGNAFVVEKRSRDAALRLSQDEVRRLA